MKNKKAISGIIVTMILIVITLVIGSIVWGVVNSLVNQNLDKAGSCYQSFDKIQIDSRYTCYDGANNKIHVSVALGDASVDSVLVSMVVNGTSRTFTLTNQAQSFNNVAPYGGQVGEDIKLPSKNGASTYIYSWDIPTAVSTFGVDEIQIAPIINNNDCGPITLASVDSC